MLDIDFSLANLINEEENIMESALKGSSDNTS